MSAVFCHPSRTGPFARPALRLRMLFHRHKIKHFQGNDNFDALAGLDKIGQCQALERVHGPVAEVYQVVVLVSSKLLRANTNPKGM